MKPTATIVGVVFSFCVVLALALWVMRSVSVNEAQIEQYREQLSDESLLTRANAAEELVRYDPTDHKAACIGADALRQVHGFERARLLLGSVRHDGRQPGVAFQTARVLNYIAKVEYEARRVVHGSPAALTAVVNDELVAAGEVCDRLRQTHRSEPLAWLRLRAMVDDAEAQAQWLALRRAGLEDGGDEPLTTTVRTTDVTRRDARLEALARLNRANLEVERYADRLDAFDEARDLALWLRFRVHLRRGKVQAARAVAAQLAGLPAVDRDVAGRAARVLLSIEAFHAPARTERDMALARALVEHEALTGDESLAYDVAAHQLALADQRAADALAIAEKMLRRGHPDANALRCRALLADGQIDHALNTIERAAGLQRTAIECRVHGQVLLAKRELRRGRETLARAVELDPLDMQALLMLIRSYDRTNELSVVTDQIQAASRINPINAEAASLRTRLMVQTNDYRSMAHLVVSGYTRIGRPVRADDVILMGLMAMDEREAVKALLATSLREPIPVALPMVATGWVDGSAEVRASVSAAAARAMLAVIAADPMRLPGEPWVPARHIPVTEAPIEGRPYRAAVLFERPFIPSPVADTHRLVELATDRWPNDPRLTRLAARFCALRGDLPRAARWYRLLSEPPQGIDQAIQAMAEGRRDRALSLLSAPSTDEGQAMLAMHLRLRLAADAAERRMLLRTLLTRWPWSFESAAAALDEEASAGDEAAVDALLGAIEACNPVLARMMRARVRLAHGRAAEARDELNLLLEQEPEGSQVRRWATDTLVSTSVALGKAGYGAIVLERLAEAQVDAPDAVVAARAGVLAHAGEPATAKRLISPRVLGGQTPERWVDVYLVQARLFMSRGSFERLLAAMEQHSDVDASLVTLHRAQAVADEGRVLQAETLLNTIGAIRVPVGPGEGDDEPVIDDSGRRPSGPQSPRARLLLAELMHRSSRTDVARTICEELIARGGATALAAEALLERLAAPTASGEEGQDE